MGNMYKYQYRSGPRRWGCPMAELGETPNYDRRGVLWFPPLEGRIREERRRTAKSQRYVSTCRFLASLNRSCASLSNPPSTPVSCANHPIAKISSDRPILTLSVAVVVTSSTSRQFPDFCRLYIYLALPHPASRARFCPLPAHS